MQNRVFASLSLVVKMVEEQREMRKRRNNLITTMWIVFLGMLLFSPGCKKHNPVSAVGGEVTINVTATFCGKVLKNIPVTLDCEGKRYESKTQGGVAKVDLDSAYTCNIMVNFSNSQAQRNQKYIPSVFENVSLGGGEILTLDIAEVDKLNPEKNKWDELLNIYRGRDHPDGVNQVWRQQPKKWVVYDPHGYLKQFSDPRNNPIFDNIMKGFRAIQEYTNGFITAPSRDEVEIRYETKHWVDNGIFFEITDGDPYEADDSRNNEIIRSGAGARYSAYYDTIGEIVSSVQGGDNEGGRVYSVMGGTGYVTNIDKIWGRFNYHKRLPGDKFFLNGPYGHLYEQRRLKK